jgi:hypothetical protein
MEADMGLIGREKHVRQCGLFDSLNHIKSLSQRGDPLEVLARAAGVKVPACFIGSLGVWGWLEGWQTAC